jgi:hypothetical protein
MDQTDKLNEIQKWIFSPQGGNVKVGERGIIVVPFRFPVMKLLSKIAELRKEN